MAGPHPGASRASPFSLRWSLSCAGSEGGPRGTDLPLPREEVGGEGLPSVPGQEERRPRPPASTQALAPLWRLSVSRAVDAGHLLVMGPSSRSRDPPRSPIPSVLFAPPGSGKEPRVGSPPHPASDPELRGASLRWEPRSKFFQARTSCVRKEPGEDVDGTGAGSACNPDSSGCKWPCSDWERPGKTASPGRAVPKQRARGTQRLADNEISRVGVGRGRVGTYLPWIRLRPSSAPPVAALPAPAPPSGFLLPRAPPPKSPPTQPDFFRLLLAPPRHSRFGN